MWYYTTDGQQHGPLDEGALDQMISHGTITPETLVWKEGLADWVPLKQTRPVPASGAVAVALEPAASSTCAICGKKVGADNLIELLGQPVCAACKPLAVQRMKEGAALTGITHAWRDRKRVVTYDKSALPARCYKCNEPVAGQPLKRKLYWHPALYYILVPISILLYAVVAIIVRKRASVEVYLCPAHAQRRKYFLIGTWIGIVFTLVLGFAGILNNINWLIGIAAILFLVAIIIGITSATLARALRIKGDTVWMGGAGPEFLASLPPWP
jgi:hypothetical protein